MAAYVVTRADALTGARGELLFARGEQVALRLWEHEPSGEQSPNHENDYEYVAYVLEGALRVYVDGNALEVDAGDSYVIPSGTPYAFEVLEAATVIEAVAPPQPLD
jgi:quercetin dioxygenase-like cupin family protein